MHITVVANPAAGTGRGLRELARLRPLFRREGVTDIRVTQRTGDEARLTRDALDDGADAIIALGGDGTWSRVAAVLGAARAPISLALLAAGRGNDFAKTLQLPARDAAATVRLIRESAWRACDMGRVDDRWFLNVAGFGFDAHVLEHAVNAGGGALAYVAVALRELRAYRPLRVAIDDEPPRDTLILALANGRYFGGTFSIAPAAAIDDGLIDVVHIGDVSPIRRLPLLARAVAGTHLSHDAATHRSIAHATLTFGAVPMFEADGELHQAASTQVRIGVEPGVLRLTAPRT
jgi:diacylglycerol kinase (ATP)